MYISTHAKSKYSILYNPNPNTSNKLDETLESQRRPDIIRKVTTSRTMTTVNRTTIYIFSPTKTICVGVKCQRAHNR